MDFNEANLVQGLFHTKAGQKIAVWSAVNEDEIVVDLFDLNFDGLRSSLRLTKSEVSHFRNLLSEAIGELSPQCPVETQHLRDEVKRLKEHNSNLVTNLQLVREDLEDRNEQIQDLQGFLELATHQKNEWRDKYLSIENDVLGIKLLAERLPL